VNTDSEPHRGSTVTLREITRETLIPILRLSVAPEQQRFVASNAVSIAQAYFDREVAWFRGIYAGETAVGFLMLSDKPHEGEYFLWRYMIDQRYQRLGFGKRALEHLVEHVRTRPRADTLGVSCVGGEGSPCPFYERFGFVPTGEVDDGEIVLRLDLRQSLPDPGSIST
jgi:diamine N-acetyltransferase